MSSKKISVTLTYASTGTQPPIFLAGSFSEPAWDPQEMEFTTDENGEHHFHKEVEVDEGGQFQYKFRIGLGDWWALNEQAPTATDELGNRNNLLAVPTAEEIVEKSKSSESTTAPPVSDTPIPELVVEKVDEESQHGDDFGPDATTGQKDAHDMKALDAEPDHVMIRSQTNTPVYANTAAEVADSAAMLDREPSPVPVSDEEAGRTGERRMSGTPIPQVALTAAEVADVAAILDQDDQDDMRMSLPYPNYQLDTHSGQSTPWHDRAPLFAHECLGPNDGAEFESPITSESLESPTKAEAEGEVIDLNDPLLERFPEDRMSILTHIRSCESRMSEDETNVHGVPPSPINKPKSHSSSIDIPGSVRLDAQPSPALDVIAEEHHEEDSYFGGLPGPSQMMQGAEEIRVLEELIVIQEAEEPAEDPKTVLENLRKIEESTDSNKSTVKEETIKSEVDEHVPVEGSGIAEERNKTDDASAQPKELAKESLDHNAEDSRPGPPVIEVQTDAKDYVVSEDPHADLEEVCAPENISDTSVHPSDSPEKVRNQAGDIHDDSINNIGQYQSEDGPMPEVLMEPKKDFNEHEEVNEESKDVVQEEELHQNSELLHAEHDEDRQNIGVDSQSILVEHSEPVPIVDPQPVESTGEVPEDEGPKDGLNDIMQPQENEEPQQHDSHLHSVEAEQHLVKESQDMAELLQISESQEPEESQLSNVNGISIGGVIAKDIPAESTIEVRDVAQVSVSQGLTEEHDVLGTDAHQSVVALKIPQTEVETPHEADLSVSKMNVDDVVPLIPEQDALDTDAHRSAIALENPQTEIQRSIEADLPILETKADEVSLTPEHNILGSKSQESAIPVENASTKAEATHEADLPISQMKVDEQTSQMPEQQVLDSEVDKPATIEASVPEVETSHEAVVPISQAKVDEVPVMPEGQVLVSEVDKSATIEVPVPEVGTEADVPISQKKVDDEVPVMPEEQILVPEVNKSAALKNTHPEAETTTHEANLPISRLKVNDEIPPIHVRSATSDSSDIGEVDGPLTNGVDTGKSTSVDDLSSNGYDNSSKLSPRKTTTPNIERPPTPSSICSPMKAPESENFFKAIWRIVFVEWLGGLFASLCSGDRGP